MNNISFWSSKLLTSWRYCKPFASSTIHRINFSGANFNDSLEDSMDTASEKREKYANEVRLLGRVGTDAIVGNKDGKNYAKFSLATCTHWKTDGEEHQKTDWHTVLVFEPHLVTAAGKYIKKGQRLYLAGKLSYSIDNSSKKSAFIILQNFINISQ